MKLTPTGRREITVPVAAVYDRQRRAGGSPKTATMKTTLTERRYKPSYFPNSKQIALGAETVLSGTPSRPVAGSSASTLMVFES